MLYQRREETVQIQAEYNRVLNERKAIEEALRQLKVRTRAVLSSIGTANANKRRYSGTIVQDNR